MPEVSGSGRPAHLCDPFDAKPTIAFFGRYARKADVVLDIRAGAGRIAVPLSRQRIGVFDHLLHDEQRLVALRSIGRHLRLVGTWSLMCFPS
jgi:hypothetical protein